MGIFVKKNQYKIFTNYLEIYIINRVKDKSNREEMYNNENEIYK